MPDEILLALGIHLSVLIAGLAGGVLACAPFRRQSAGVVVWTIIAGGALANYTVGVAGTSNLEEAFFVGMGVQVFVSGRAAIQRERNKK